MRGGAARFDEVGKRYGRLRVLDRLGLDRYRTLCTCGTEKVIRGTDMRAGHRKSCGCDALERTAAAKRKHGHTTRRTGPSRAYRIWCGMRKRCNNQDDQAYRYYGGRGITVCARWDDFALFIADMGDPPTSRHSIERLNTNGHYEPSNCRWATAAEQNRNTRQNVLLTYGGRTQCLTDWAAEFGLKMTTLNNRLFRYGWELHAALTTPVGSHKRSNRYLVYGGRRLCVREWERDLGFSYGAISHRLKKGWSVERALMTPKLVNVESVNVEAP